MVKFEFNLNTPSTQARADGLLNAVFGRQAAAIEVPVTVRTLMVEPGPIGLVTRESTYTKTVRLEAGVVIGQETREPGVFGEKVVTVTYEGLNHYTLPIETEYTERATVFGNICTTTIKIGRSSDPVVGGAVNRPVNSRVTITAERSTRPGRRLV